jgi:hypothetical protein
MAARGGQQQTGGEPDREHRRGVLVQERESAERAERQPQPRLAAQLDLDQDRQAAGPEQELEGVDGEDPEEHLEDRRREHGAGGHELPPPAGAQARRGPAGQERRRRPRQRREQPDRGQRVAEQADHRGEQRRRQRRMVDEAPGEPAGAGDVVELVDEVAVAEAEHERQVEEREAAGGEHGERGPGRPAGCRNSGRLGRRLGRRSSAPRETQAPPRGT